MAKHKKKDGKAAQTSERQVAKAKPDTGKPDAKKQVASSAVVVPSKKTPAEKRKSQIEGIIKTVVPSALGVVVGFSCYYLIGPGLEYPWFFVMLNVLLATIIVQRLIYPFFSINVQDFKAKDWIYVEFIAVDLWLLSWTILLN